MSDIAKGILSGGWLLVAGWILPTAINALVFGFFILPSLHAIPIVGNISHAGVTERALAVLVVAVVGGLMLNALQAPLYRVLEGYLWPASIARKFRNRQLRAKHLLQDRLDAIRLRTLNNQSRLEKPEDKQRLAELSADPSVSKFAKRDQARTTVQRSLLRERLRRFPVDDAQVAPTRLGNAIRRLEEYGYNRYRLDSQALWYELTAAASKELSRQVDTARATTTTDTSGRQRTSTDGARQVRQNKSSGRPHRALASGRRGRRAARSGRRPLSRRRLDPNPRVGR